MLMNVFNIVVIHMIHVMAVECIYHIALLYPPRHMIMITVCGISRNYCDQQFNTCMQKGCGQDTKCKESAQMITMGAQLFGCGPYLEGQRKECDCLPQDQFDKRVIKTLKEMYDKLPTEYQKTEEKLEQIREKYRGKEGKLLNNILKKYPKYLIEMVDFDGNPLKTKPKKEL